MANSVVAEKVKAKALAVVDRYQGYELKSCQNEKIEVPFDEIGTLADNYVIDEPIEFLAEKVVKLLTAKGKTLSVAESLTGGGLASAIVSVSGASKVFDFGIVSYSNKSKNELLAVSSATLSEMGAVSYNTALEMARGVLSVNDYSLSTTGIAGPCGDGICEKVGTVFLGFADKKQVKAYGFLFKGSREEVRSQSIQASLSILLCELTRETKE